MNHSNDTNNFSDRTAFLLLRYYNGEITESEAAEFLEIHRKMPDFQELLEKEFRLDLLLRARSGRIELQKTLEMLEKEREFEAGSDRNEVDIAMIDWALLSRMESEGEAISRKEDAEFEKTTTSRIRSKPEISHRKRRQGERIEPWRTVLLLLLILVPAVLMIRYEFYPPSENASSKTFKAIGRITSVAEPVFSEGSAIFKTGQHFENEQIRLESGLVEMELDNGIRLVLEGPADFRLDSTMSTFCQLGRLSAFVPPEGKGFEVVTPKVTVRDLGTEFVLDVTEQQAEVHVVTGKVEANWLTKDWFTFPENRGVRIASSGKTEQIAADILRFMTRTQMEKKASDYEKAESERRRTALTKFLDDPSLRYCFEADSVRNATGTKVSGCLSVPGCVSGSKAVLIRNKNDRIETDISGRFEAMSLVAAVRLDRWNGTHTLLVCNEFYDRAGTFFWQLDRTGNLKFHLQRSKEGRLSIDYFDSTPVFTQRECGVWATLAVVIDPGAETLTHYFDGRAVAVLPYRNKEPLKIGAASLGGGIAARKKTDNYWNGAIESLLIFNRPLSGKEIEELTIY